MKKKIIILAIVLIIIIALGVFIYTEVDKYNKDKQLAEENMKIILNNYKELEENVTKYNKSRNDYRELVKDFYLDSFKDKNEEYLKFLNDYTAIMKEIDINITNIDSKCNRLYSDSEANKICNNYKKIYEKLVNLYIDDITKYNEKVKEYNEYRKEEVSLFKCNYTDFIDYNEDGVYEGRDNSENTKEKSQD